MKTKKPNAFLNKVKQYSGALTILVVLLVVLALTTKTFMRVDNILSVLRNISVNGLLAAGITCVIIIGCIDLSLGSTCAAASVISVVLNTSMGWNVWISIIVAILVGGFIGSINGIIRAKTMLPPFIITLAMQQTIRGIAYVFTEGTPIISTDNTFNAIGKLSWPTIYNAAGEKVFEGIPVIFFIMIVALVIVDIILSRTRLGRHMYAVGGNMEAAKHSGISYTKIAVSAYVIMGIMAGLGGVIMSSRLYSGQPTIGVDFSTDAIASAVLGGTAFGGGYGSIMGSFIGACIIGVLNSGMSHLKIDAYWQMVVKGILILVAVYYDSIKDDLKIKRKKKAEG
ncbi:MAG: ABC transporter permease [Lachnospiraceae bacterium]|nr:ABC transporter permease [Lachnospiraceae bacterium]